jgi:streptogrisin C
MVVAVLAATLGATVPAQADSGRLDPRQVRGSIAYLHRTFGVSESEALRRLELQARGQSLAGKLEQRAAGSYAGMWMDHAHGGRLVVAAKAPGVVAGMLAGLPDRAHVTVARVSRSLTELQALRQRVADEVGDGQDSILQPRVDEKANQVVVWNRDWLVAERSFSMPAQTSLSRVVAESRGAVVVRSAPKPNPLTTAADVHECFALYCAGYGAMRGGLRLDIQRDNGTWGGCTSGFNVRARGGAYDGQAFVLTAGHCVASWSHQHSDVAYHQGKPVLREEPALTMNNVPYDYALMPYVDQVTANVWLNAKEDHNLVLEWCRDGAWDSNSNTPCDNPGPDRTGRINITRVSEPADVHQGWVLCASGAGASSLDFTDAVDSAAGQGYRPGTRCGLVTGQSNGLIDTDLCARAGDSGGPLFDESTSAAVGILEGNTQDRSGPCAADESNNYIPLSTIFGSLNGTKAAQGSTFQVITARQG